VALLASSQFGVESGVWITESWPFADILGFSHTSITAVVARRCRHDDPLSNPIKLIHFPEVQSAVWNIHRSFNYRVFHYRENAGVQTEASRVQRIVRRYDSVLAY